MIHRAHPELVEGSSAKKFISNLKSLIFLRIKRALEDILQQVQDERSEVMDLCLILSLPKDQGKRNLTRKLYES